MFAHTFNLIVQLNAIPLTKDSKRKIWTLYDPNSPKLLKFQIHQDNVYDLIIISALELGYVITNPDFYFASNSACRESFRIGIEEVMERLNPKGKATASRLLKFLR